MRTAIRMDLDPRDWHRHQFGLPNSLWQNLKQEVFWVTGGGTGFGRSLACALSAAGARVIITGRREAKLRETQDEASALGCPPGAIYTLCADITQAEELESACVRVEALTPALTGLIHSAALPSRPGSSSPLRNDPEEYWDRLLALNLTAPWRLTRRIFAHMARGGRVRVLFLSSGAAWAATPGYGPYNISKAALNSLSHSLAQEMARDFPSQDIQVNTLVPGEACTEMNQGSTASPYSLAGMALHLLAQPPGGPNGRFFGMGGDHISFGETGPYGQSLAEPVRSPFPAASPANAPTRAEESRVLCLSRLLAYDSSPEDRRVLEAAAHCLTIPGRVSGIYGAGRLTRYLLQEVPHLAQAVRCIIDDDPDKAGSSIEGVPVTTAAKPPVEVTTWLLSSTQTVPVMNMQAKLRTFDRKQEWFALSIIADLDPEGVPARAWVKGAPSIYPMELPPIEFRAGLDMVLLELPPRYMPMMPYGLAYVHNILEDAGVKVQTMDLNILFYHRYHTRRILDRKVETVTWAKGNNGIGDPWDTLNTADWLKPEHLLPFEQDMQEAVNALVRAQPKVIGISLNGNNREVAKWVCREVKRILPQVVIVVGGFECFSEGRARPKWDFYEYMVIGEAENSLPGLVRGLLGGEKPKDLPGVLSKYDSPNRIWQPAPMPTDLEAISFPRYQWTDIKLYRTFYNYNLVPLATSRGCHWGRCNFCAEALCYRKRDPLSVADEIQWYTQNGFHNFHFNESDVNGDPENLKVICEEILRRGLKVDLYGQLRIDKRNTLEFFGVLKAAGFSKLRFGVDGWCDNSLRRENKGYNMRIVEQNLRDCTRARLSASVNWVIGVPGETEADIDEALVNVTRLKNYIGAFETLNMLRLFVDSRFHSDPDRFNIHFRGDREEIYKEHQTLIPEHLWYSEEPYIDHRVRVERFRRICRHLHLHGIEMSGYVKWEAVEEIGRIEGRKPRNFEDAILDGETSGQPPHGCETAEAGRHKPNYDCLDQSSALDLLPGRRGQGAPQAGAR